MTNDKCYDKCFQYGKIVPLNNYKDLKEDPQIITKIYNLYRSMQFGGNKFFITRKWLEKVWRK